jgi:DNA-binding MurR/RpiR family transcriptional regulator
LKFVQKSNFYLDKNFAIFFILQNSLQYIISPDKSGMHRYQFGIHVSKKRKYSMEEHVQQRIARANLTAQEQRIAEKITRNLSKAAFLTGPQLAKECDVSASAITRFAQKLGYSGAPELKLELERAFRKTITPYEMFNEYLAGPQNPSMSQESVAQDLQNIMNMQNILDRQVLEQVITALESANTVYAAAISGSDVAARLLCFYLRVLGKSNQLLCGFGLSKQIEVTEIGQGDVFVAISYQRIFREVRDAALFAKQQGACTVAITDSVANALAQVCDFTLIAPVSGASFGFSHAAPVAMINILVNSLAARNPEQSLKELEKMKKSWETTHIFCST